MADHPILMSTLMVRALLAGNKTQTRRPGKGLPATVGPFQRFQKFSDENTIHAGFDSKVRDASGKMCLHFIRCPYGQPGDRLWVKETTVNVEEHGFEGPVYAESEAGYAYLEWGLGPVPVWVEAKDLKLRPSIYMSKKMARLHLEVTAVRIERLQDISEADAIAEGVERLNDVAWKDYFPRGIGRNLGWKRGPTTNDYGCGDAIRSYRSLWESINGPNSWSDNPWVWVVEFRRIQPS